MRVHVCARAWVCRHVCMRVEVEGEECHSDLVFQGWMEYRSLPFNILSREFPVSGFDQSDCSKSETLWLLDRIPNHNKRDVHNFFFSIIWTSGLHNLVECVAGES